MTTQPTTTPFPSGGVKILPNEILAGQKRAVLVNRCLHVSPAFYSLCKSSTPQELWELMSSLEFIDLSDEQLVFPFLH